MRSRPITISPAIRDEARIEALVNRNGTSSADAGAPLTARTNELVTIRGAGFGKLPGTVAIGRVTAEIIIWGPSRIVFVVPEEARTGTVAINCPSNRSRRVLTIAPD